MRMLLNFIAMEPSQSSQTDHRLSPPKRQGQRFKKQHDSAKPTNKYLQDRLPPCATGVTKNAENC